jgi:hypothetical protein
LQEIVVRIEYKYSPNLTIIDTPGLISAAPGKKNTALQQAAKAVETMVTQKMMQQVRQEHSLVFGWARRGYLIYIPIFMSASGL